MQNAALLGWFGFWFCASLTHSLSRKPEIVELHYIYDDEVVALDGYKCVLADLLFEAMNAVFRFCSISPTECSFLNVYTAKPASSNNSKCALVGFISKCMKKNSYIKSEKGEIKTLFSRLLFRVCVCVCVCTLTQCAIACNKIMFHGYM